MRFVLASAILLCALQASSADVFTLGGDPIGPNSSTTDGRGATSAVRCGPEEVYRGQPGVVFSLNGWESLRTLRSIVTFTSQTPGAIRVPNHRFRARLWTLKDYLHGNPYLHDVELGLPEGVEFQTLADGSVVPREPFGEAGGNIPAGVPSYDFRWNLSSHSALATPLPAGNYVLALYALSAANEDGEFHVGRTHGPLGLPSVFFANSECRFGPDYVYPCFFSDPCLSWAITLQIETHTPCEECEEHLDEFPVYYGSEMGLLSTGYGGTFGELFSGAFGPFGLSPGGLSSPGVGSPLSPSGPMQPLFDSGTSSTPPGEPPMFPPFLPPDWQDPPDWPDMPPETLPTPEPSSLVLFVLGALILGALRRSKNRLAN